MPSAHLHKKDHGSCHSFSGWTGLSSVIRGIQRFVHFCCSWQWLDMVKITFIPCFHSLSLLLVMTRCRTAHWAPGILSFSSQNTSRKIFVFYKRGSRISNRPHSLQKNLASGVLSRGLDPVSQAQSGRHFSRGSPEPTVSLQSASPHFPNMVLWRQDLC